LEKKKNEFLEAEDIHPSSSSFELKRTRNGISITAKVYACDTHDDVENARKECEEQFNKLLKKYKEE
jgi:hypothetical protein